MITSISKYQVLRSNAGYYIGRTCISVYNNVEIEEPYDRLTGYFKTREQAERALHMEEVIGGINE